ncbi:MAG: TrkH family potassium uptake protein, partial [Alphaproteobacteria bacterium]|nr:TrkH family potassium uptake protein [Alphaproteobacteria bacterium]
MLDLKPVLYVIGVLLSILSMGMTVPMLTDLHIGHEDWKVFFLCTLITAFFGGCLILGNSGHNFSMNKRQAFLVTILSWLSVATFSALPFYLSALDMDFTDAFFEATSGITTTGSTVIIALDSAPPGILIWRSILQWLGGIGIIIMALSMLPYMNIGGMQLFRTERSDNEKALPRTASLAGSIAIIYVFLTLGCTICYTLAGMGRFDAIAHAMTTISTGGFSTHDSSIGHFQNDSIRFVSVVFMILGGLPFALYLNAAKNGMASLLRDSQVRWFFAILFISTTAATINLVSNFDKTPAEAIIASAFNVVSLITGTGFTSDNYDLWGGFIVAMLFFLMATGACAGSTTCAIKIFRFQILYAVIVIQIKKLLHPSGVYIAHYNCKPI